MLVKEQLEYLGRLHGMTERGAADATWTWLERLGIADRATSKVETLSHGNQQRVQLAAALVHAPELVVLDEPLAGLDPAGIDAIGEVLVQQARAGCCVLLSSHQLDLVEDLCDSVTIIDHGRLVVSGSVNELATSGPRSLVVRVAGDRDGTWARRLAGVTVSDLDRGAVRLVLDESVDSQAVLAAAMAAGRVTEFVFARRRLSEVFRQAMALGSSCRLSSSPWCWYSSPCALGSAGASGVSDRCSAGAARRLGQVSARLCWVSSDWSPAGRFGNACAGASSASPPCCS
jgi:ABC-2 type transport system ATP-binding protein